MGRATMTASAGPLIDLSQAVPGYPPHPEMLERLGRSGCVARGGRLRRHRSAMRRCAKPTRRTFRRSTARASAPENVAITAGCNQAFFVADAGAREGRRSGDAADALVFQSQDGARHARHRSRAASLPRGERVRARCGGCAPAAAPTRVRAIVLVTPNNPTGAVYPPATIACLQGACAPSAASRSSSTRPIAISSPPTVAPHAAFAEPGLAGDDHPALQLLQGLLHSRPPRRRAGGGAPEWSARSRRSSIRCRSARRACRSWCCPGRSRRWPTGAARTAIEIDRRAQRFKEAIGAARRLVDRLDRRLFRLCGASLRRRDATPRSARGWRAERGVLCLPGSYFGPAQEGFLRVAFANVEASIGDRRAVAGAARRRPARRRSARRAVPEPVEQR